VTRLADDDSANGEWTPIHVERLFEKVAVRVETDILESRLLPGQKLPNETELGRRMGVGRSAVREALKTLELRGLLEVRRGFNGGTFVRATDLNEAPFELHLSRWPVATEHDAVGRPHAATSRADSGARGPSSRPSCRLRRERDRVSHRRCRCQWESPSGHARRVAGDAHQTTVERRVPGRRCATRAQLAPGDHAGDSPPGPRSSRGAGHRPVDGTAVAANARPYGRVLTKSGCSADVRASSQWHVVARVRRLSGG
jgi:DNA-binding transcriptional regulator YhcF (GntR family)